MRICLITPSAPAPWTGNRVTARRWARLLRALGHRVTVREAYRDEPCDVLIALHARRSAEAVERFRRAHPGHPVIVALTGTDLYADLRESADARRALDLATRVVVLQSEGVAALPDSVRAKARVIYQSAEPPRRRLAPLARVFEVCVIANLRAVKDPLRTAWAARLLPPASRIRVTHVGAALEDEWARAARAEMRANPRYRWLGALPPWRTRRLLARSRLLVLSSEMEGGANVLSEALAASVPVLATRIPGSVGVLGPEYPGYFPVGDTDALAALLWRAETDRAFYRALSAHCRRAKSLVSPDRERRCWRALLEELRRLGGSP